MATLIRLMSFQAFRITLDDLFSSMVTAKPNMWTILEMVV